MLLIMVVLSLVYGVVSTHLYVVSLFSGVEAPAPFSLRFLGAVGDEVRGRLSPDAALMVVLAAVAVCATINVALAVDNSSAGLLAQAAISQWRTSLQRAAALTGGAALIAGVAVWANLRPESGHDLGAAIAVSVFAVVTVQLAVTARDQRNSADRASEHRQAVKHLATLKAWDGELAARKVPRPLPVNALIKAGIDAVAEADSVRRTAMRACWKRLAYVGLAQGVCMAAVLVCLIVTGPHGPPPEVPLSAGKIWGLRTGFVVLPAVLAVLISLGIGMATHSRWTNAVSDHVRRHLDIKPRVICGVTSLAAVGLVALMWLAAGAAVGPVWISFLLVAAATWGVLQISRRCPRVTWCATAARPLWELVDLSLRQSRARSERNRDTLLDQEIERRTALPTSKARR
ncbi:hypothetical protein KIH27_20410 [Mycobacterium sp. M1]|uniref:Uncharacterized protein n=1 Tax=Mycolicibacter acidiphilus TaxID=2835306 RepID=A0ABS5RNR2_9MYCO|nr:hypothetical protein [Mycolicibacter acidiphilus]MBS9535950.1 hypothetical protein [Mycolicibacter acidiphilus]